MLCNNQRSKTLRSVVMVSNDVCVCTCLSVCACVCNSVSVCV